MVSINTDNLYQENFCPFTLHKISVLIEFSFGHLRYNLTDVPPQPNSPTDNVLNKNDLIIKKSIEVEVFHGRLNSLLCYTLNDFSKCQTRVKLNRVFFPR